MHDRGNIYIERDIDLHNTANIIGILLLVNFSKEDDGRYDEFPAYVGSTHDHHYALLGTPDDIAEDDSDDIYQLIIRGHDRSKIHDGINDISMIVADIIRKTGKLKCWTIKDLEEMDELDN